MSPVPPAPGIYTPVPTFFKNDGYTIDFDANVKHAKFLKDNGIAGLVIMGSTGEGVHLTKEERAATIKAVHDALPDFPIIGGVVQNSVQDALDEIDSIKAAGATHAVVLSSNYYGAGIKQQGIIDWFTAVADKASLPILVYVYPGVSNNLFTDPATVIKLSGHPNIVGTKISHGDVSHHTIIATDKNVQQNNFNTFTGLGQLLVPTLTIGCKGTIDALSGAFPKIYVKIFQLVQDGKIEEAVKLQNTVSRGEEIVVNFGVIGIKKAIHLGAGIGENYLGRAPLNQDLPAGAWENLEHYFKEIQAVERTL
ncbi:L-KDR aldolase [Komagataella phaffii CBS 7435]|uniref:Aldolase n=2 Tax=Komagataella phaffii TaxID=460519 RepID=C4R7K9_KOMPG|nr:Hypothetical protein PAS_chr4_0341 [Komagataella phaffii GS115]AOA65362.1 GQ67_04681T0 [Komagataella phaffii]CAH2451040.1 L-KDR aldolase [Komagataella phaffii CBS 7435]AOA70189.1 GQ68_04653T0 [Komagataella phaffii GS115]CAY71584.1 Hypothetical protein PAS_chr4_0341 [Komagataella phaffii GS115]CCA40811.1 L-KDR aldolase [Komagataella phaffii CBS 7435]